VILRKRTTGGRLWNEIVWRRETKNYKEKRKPNRKTTKKKKTPLNNVPPGCGRKKALPEELKRSEFGRS